MIADDIARKITETAARIAKYENELKKEKKTEKDIADAHDTLKKETTAFEQELDSVYQAMNVIADRIDAPGTILAQRCRERIRGGFINGDRDTFFSMVREAAGKAAKEVQDRKYIQKQLNKKLREAKEELARLNTQKNQPGGMI